jgi:hypothetical protein
VNPLVWVGLLLAFAAFALLAWVLYSHVEERGGKKSGTSSLPTVDPTAAPSSTDKTPIAPGSVVVPAPTTPKDPLPPLEPSPTPSASGAATGTAGARPRHSR